MRSVAPTVFAFVAGSVPCASAFAKVTVTLYNGLVQVRDSQTFADGANVTVSDSVFGLSVSEAQSVNRVVITGGTGGYSGAVTIALSTSGSTPTSVEISSIGNCGGLSATSPSSRHLVLSISSSGNITGDFSVNSVTAAQIGGTLNANFTIAANTQTSLEFGGISASATLNVVSGSIDTLTIDGGSDGTVILQNGSIALMQFGLGTTPGRLGGSVIVDSLSTTSGGRIETIRNLVGAGAPTIGSSVVGGSPTVSASIWAKNGIGRITGSKMYADIRANGNFSYTPPGGSAVTVATTSGGLIKLQSSSSSDWFKGSIAAASFSDTGSSTEFPGISIAGSYDGKIKPATIAPVNAYQPTKILVGDVPVDPPTGPWLDLKGARVTAQGASSAAGIIWGADTSNGTTTIAAPAAGWARLRHARLLPANLRHASTSLPRARRT